MADMIKFGMEAMLGMIFIVIATNVIAVSIAGGNFTALAGLIVAFVDVILVALYLYGLYKNFNKAG